MRNARMALALLTTALWLAACGDKNPEHNDGPMESAGEEMDETADDISEGTEEAVEETGDTFEEAGDDIEDATD